jgi:CTP synthase (UTP-ammonia lyase)
MGIAGADSAENKPGSPDCVITPLSCALPNRREGGPKGSGDEHIKILPGTVLHSICGSQDNSEQYFCNYGVNQEFEQRFIAAGLRVSARGGRGEIRAVEQPGLRFFIATLFQPQLSSRPESPHPILLEYLSAAMRFKKERSRKKRNQSQ